MLKTGIKFIILAVAIVTILEVLNPIFAKPHFFIESVADIKKEDDIELIFFGNSHAHFTYDPRIFEKELGVKTFNLSTPGQRLVSTQASVDFVLQDHTPKLAIVDLFSLSLEEPNNEKYKNFQSQVLDYIPFSFKKADVTYEVYGWKDFLKGTYTVLRYHNNWHTIQYPEKKFKFPSKQDYYKGFASYTTILGPEVWKQAETVYKKQKRVLKQLTFKEKQRIDAIIDQFDNSGVEVLFVTAPDFAQDIGITYKSYTSAIKKYVETRNKSFLDLGAKWDDIGLTKKDFRDFNHLNTNGAIKTSAYLAEYLKKQYDFSPSFKELPTNRYAVVEKESEALYRINLSDSVVQKTGGINEVVFYKKNDNYYEALLFTNNDTITNNSVKVTFEYTNSNSPLNKNYELITKDGIVYNYGKFQNDNLVRYKGKHFFYMSFYWSHPELKSIAMYGGDNRDILMFQEDSIILNNP